MLLNYKYNIGLLMVFLCWQISNAQYTPFFQNYSLSKYNVGNQNWGITKSENGKLYVANNKGLLEYDGFKWRLLELPNKTTIRSVLALEDRIYTGSYEEFGYWETNKKGILEYTSLTKNQDKYKFLNEEFWEIVHFNGILVFRSFLNIYLFKDGVVSKIKKDNPASKIKLSSTFMSLNKVNDTLYVSTLKEGVFTLNNTQLSSAIENNLLVDSKVVSIVKNNNKRLVLTALKGCFFYDNNKLLPWESEINALIKQYQLNSHTQLENGNMIFGTIQNGVYYTDSNGNIIFHINKENGLANNTILSQYVDYNKQLWLGLDNGLTSIDLYGNHSFYNDISGRLGAVYDVILYDKRMYIASNTGLYFLDEQNDLQFIEGSQGQVWDLNVINGELFCGHNNGTYLVTGRKLKYISSYTGGWVIKKAPENNVYIQGTYAGLVCFKKENNTWSAKHLDGTTNPIRFLEFQDEYTAWAAHAHKGLYRINFNKNYDSIEAIKSYKNKGLTSNFNVRVYKIKNDICFKTNTGWYKYEPLLDSIIPYNLLNQRFGKNAYIVSGDNTNSVAVKKKERISFSSFSPITNGLSLPLKYFKNRLIIGYENVSKIKDSIYALNLNDGFILIDRKAGVVKDSLYSVTIENVRINKKLIDLDNISKKIEIPFNNSLTVAISSPKSRDHFFEYTLSEQDTAKWSKIENEQIELSNLNNGDYSLAFRVSNVSGDTSAIKEMKFTVLPPWHKGVGGLLLSIMALLITSLIAYYFHKRKIVKEQKVLQVKFELEQEAMLKEKTIENDKKIIEFKNESLKNEIKLKSKQLANTAMALVKKNESILELKSALIQNKSGFDNAYSFKKLLRKIDNSIGHEDEWEIFEYNFNQVHEEFFNKLKLQFPALTHKDLKICAYIKMNLSTKEIAPLMNISIRGVETHRYRLKRKLYLENDKSLVHFLISYI